MPQVPAEFDIAEYPFGSPSNSSVEVRVYYFRVSAGRVNCVGRYMPPCHPPTQSQTYVGALLNPVLLAGSSRAFPIAHIGGPKGSWLYCCFFGGEKTEVTESRDYAITLLLAGEYTILFDCRDY